MVIDGHGLIVSPGFIDIQINGAFGIDFSTPEVMLSKEKDGLRKVALALLQHGVTSFLPTIITSQHQTYEQLVPLFKPTVGSIENGAEVLGCHVEGK